MEVIKSILNYLEDKNLYPDLKILEGAPEPETVIDGRKILMFSSNNYLGLANHPRVKAAAKAAIDKYGVGSDGSRMLSGNLKVHRDFEIAISRFKGGEDAIVWPSGYSANVGAISAIMNPPKISPMQIVRKGLIISDELNHASIIDGCRMSKQDVQIYKHCDVKDLEKKLKKSKRRRKLVITDSVFSMDGDVAPLDKIVYLCKKYNSLLMIDEAHASGVLGKGGHGSLEHFNLKAVTDVDIVLGTCSKALAASGGFVVGSKDLVDYLRVSSRSYIFSTAMLPASSAALIEGLKVIQEEPELKTKLIDNSEYLRNGFKNLGFNTLNSSTQIIPILIGEEKKAMQFTKELFLKNIFGPSVRWPAVERGQSRIRFTVMSTHTREQLDYLLEACSSIGKELKVI